MKKSIPLLLSVVFILVFLASQGRLSAEQVPATYHEAARPLNENAITEDWPRFLGPRHDLHSRETHLLKAFPEEGLKVVWEVERGQGHTPPVVADGKVFFLHIVDRQETIECRDAETGKSLWSHQYAVELSQSYGIKDASRSSPVVDGDLVFTLGVNSHLKAFETGTGKVVWEMNLDAKFGEAPFFFGRGSCPLVLGDRLIVNAGAPGACVVALDKRTGDVEWKAAHPWNASYASPVPATLRGKERIIVFAGGMTDPPHGGLLSLEPDTGIIDAALPWRSREYASVNAASPVSAGPGSVFITEGYGEGGLMVAFDPSLKIAKEAWTAPGFGCQFQTPVYHEGYLYGFPGFSESGAELVCFNAETGRQVWREDFAGLTAPLNGREIPVQLGRASLVHADGAFLCLGEQGTVLWLDLSPDGAKILTKTQPFHAPESWSTPAISRGLLYLNQNALEPRLICYDFRAP